MPHTLDRVERIIEWLSARNVPPATLLVVPGRPWSEAQIKRLRELSEGGHKLAAHGWLHETSPRKLFHKLHSTLISRNVAEHLDLDSAGVLDLLVKSQNWFTAKGLVTPDFYVPPAWALGPISNAHLAQAPYKSIETTRGLIHLQDPSAPRFESLPLTGYEADTALRERLLKVWNASQQRTAARKNKPLRISIHPDDLELRLADQLEQQIGAVAEFLDYR